jgi:YVTN family beta-propeller protein
MVTATIPVGRTPNGVAVTPNGEYVYITNEFGGSVSVINTATNTVTKNITLGGNPGPVAVTPNGEYVYVLLGHLGTVLVIDSATAPATNTLFSAVDWTILTIIIIVIVSIIVVLVWYRRGKEKTQQTQTK